MPLLELGSKTRLLQLEDSTRLKQWWEMALQHPQVRAQAAQLAMELPLLARPKMQLQALLVDSSTIEL
jgi:hypothetical protein